MPKRFGVFKNSSDPDVRIRNGLWSAAKTRRGDRPIVMPWHEGTKLALHLDNDLSYSLFAGASYEPNEFAVLDRVLKPGMVFLDGGANQGVYTVFAWARVGPTGRVIAVEPSPRELTRLKTNIKVQSRCERHHRRCRVGRAPQIGQADARGTAAFGAEHVRDVHL
jgi:hypothetical protein